MSDFLVELGANPNARTVIKRLGLPVPLPQKLHRAKGPWEERPLHDRDVIVFTGGELEKTLAESLSRAGANAYVSGELDAFTGPGEAWGRPARPLSAAPKKVHALIFDGTGIDSPSALRAAYDFFKPIVRSLGKCGRVLVLRRDPEKGKTPGASAAAAALEGFTRSLAKEIGRNGSTANLISVKRGAENRLDPVLRFMLSARSAYISGQPIEVSKRVKQKGALPDTRPLEGKVALVTGAARGIGAATAAALAAEGAHVICLDRPADDGPVSTVAYRIGGSIVLADVTDPEAGATIRKHVEETCGGRLDIVVHNAGVTRDKTLAKMDESRWDLTIGVNLQAIIDLTDALLPLIPAEGRIVCLSSIAGIAGNVGQTNYSASKSGVIGFVDHMAPVLAKKGIAINAIAPGFIETRLTAAIPVATREVARRLCNLSQGGLPKDIAETVTFLSSPGAAALCGQVVRVCGGSLVGR